MEWKEKFGKLATSKIVSSTIINAKYNFDLKILALYIRSEFLVKNSNENDKQWERKYIYYKVCIRKRKDKLRVNITEQDTK